MQFKLVIFGAILLTAGLLAYATIPNVHTISILQTLPLPASDPIPIPARGLVEIVQNVSLVAGRQNTLIINLTISSAPGQPPAVLFQVFQKNQTRSCLETRQQSYLVNQEVSNGTFQAPISRSGPYCFVFDNEGSIGAKTILITTSINSSFEQVKVTNDGEMNLMGLVAGALGFLVVFAGFMKKTVIPWE